MHCIKMYHISAWIYFHKENILCGIVGFFFLAASGFCACSYFWLLFHFVLMTVACSTQQQQQQQFAINLFILNTLLQNTPLHHLLLISIL